MPTTTPTRRKTGSLAARPVPGPDDWEAWTRHLQRRSAPLPLRKLIASGRTSPLAWPLDEAFPGSDSARLLRDLDGLKALQKRTAGTVVGRLEAWLDAAGQRPPGPLAAMECLAWCHALPPLAQLLPAAPWGQLLDHLLETAEAAAGLELAAHPLAHPLLAGELPLTLAYLFPELDVCRPLAARARDQLSWGMAELLDGEGLPHCRHAAIMRPLLACWTRCGHLARARRQPCFDDNGARQYRAVVREALRLARPDGSQALSAGQAGGACPSLFAAALALIVQRSEQAIAERVLPGKKKGDKSAAKTRLPSPAVNSEWAATAVLRPTWDRAGASLAVHYGTGDVRCELNCGGATVWSGKWDLQIDVDGRRLKPQGDLREVCWTSDEDVDYLELEADLSHGWRVQRQLLLARQDRFLLMADVLLGNHVSQIEYAAALPLSAGVRFAPAEETHEGDLVGRRRLGRALPLALPEWRSPAIRDSLQQTDAGLVLRRSARAARLYAPLLIDLNPRRLQKQLTWRQLSVAADLMNVPADVAVGYRVQLGNEQWLLYRSLAPPANRTVLGQNYSAEFVVGQFSSDGETDELLQIE